MQMGKVRIVSSLFQAKIDVAYVKAASISSSYPWQQSVSP